MLDCAKQSLKIGCTYNYFQPKHPKQKCVTLSGLLAKNVFKMSPGGAKAVISTCKSSCKCWYLGSVEPLNSSSWKKDYKIKTEKNYYIETVNFNYNLSHFEGFFLGTF